MEIEKINTNNKIKSIERGFLASFFVGKKGIENERKNKKNSFDIDVSVNFTFINSTKGICTIYY